MAQTVKRLPTMQEAWVQSLGQEDLVEKEMATHSSILTWKILWTEEPSRSTGLQRVRNDWVTSLSIQYLFFFFLIIYRLAGSLLLCDLSLVMVSRSYALLAGHGPPWWSLSLWSQAQWLWLLDPGAWAQ